METLDGWEDFIDDDELYYYEESIRANLLKQSQERFKRLPEICQRCRWMEWYIEEDCVYRLPRPHETNRCRFFSRDVPTKIPWYIRRVFFDLQWRWWKFHNRKHIGYETVLFERRVRMPIPRKEDQ